MPTQEEINQCVLQSHGNFEKVKELVEADPELVAGNAQWTETPLEAATHMGRRDIAEYLLSKGATLDIFAASMLGRPDEVDAFLQDNPALPTTNGVHGIPSLFFPALTGHVAIAETFLRHGAEVNAGNGGNTPLHGAAMHGQTQMAQWLLDRGADLTATNFEGKTPSEVAATTGHQDLAELLSPTPASAMT